MLDGTYGKALDALQKKTLSANRAGQRRLRLAAGGRCALAHLKGA